MARLNPYTPGVIILIASLALAACGSSDGPEPVIQDPDPVVPDPVDPDPDTDPVDPDPEPVDPEPAAYSPETIAGSFLQMDYQNRQTHLQDTTSARMVRTGEDSYTVHVNDSVFEFDASDIGSAGYDETWTVLGNDYEHWLWINTFVDHSADDPHGTPRTALSHVTVFGLVDVDTVPGGANSPNLEDYIEANRMYIVFPEPFSTHSRPVTGTASYDAEFVGGMRSKDDAGFTGSVQTHIAARTTLTASFGAGDVEVSGSMHDIWFQPPGDEGRSIQDSEIRFAGSGNGEQFSATADSFEHTDLILPALDIAGGFFGPNAAEVAAVVSGENATSVVSGALGGSQ